MSLRMMGVKKGGIIKNPKSSKNKYRAFTVKSSSVTNEESSGPSTSAKNAPLASADVHSSSFSHPQLTPLSWERDIIFECCLRGHTNIM